MSTRNNISKKTIREAYNELHQRRFIERLESSNNNERFVFLDKLNTEWHIIAKQLIGNLKISKLKILEVGCGYGSFSVYLSQKKANVTGIDISDKAIKISKRNAKLFKQKIKFMQASAEKLPFKNESFDVVICCDTIEHVSNYKKALDEIKRVIKKDGKIILTWPNLLNLKGILLKKSSKQPLENSFYYWTIPALLKKRDFLIEKIKTAEFFGDYSKELRPIENFCQKTPLKIFGLRVGLLAKKI